MLDIPIQQLLRSNLDAIRDLDAPIAGKRLKVCDLPDETLQRVQGFSGNVGSHDQLEALLALDARRPLCRAARWTRENGQRFGYCRSKQFGGVVCDRLGNVVELKFALGNGGCTIWKGADLAKFPKLQKVTLNNASGTLDEGWGLVKNLQVLVITAGGLTGTIPKSFSMLRELEELQITSNELTGGLPDALAGLRKLRVVRFTGNRLRWVSLSSFIA
jgi:hypothetical protein